MPTGLTSKKEASIPIQLFGWKGGKGRKGRKGGKSERKERVKGREKVGKGNKSIPPPAFAAKQPKPQTTQTI